ncbi:hypothetical protein KKH82_07925 [Patescibacteria group bacterium]|nr:hypothetical protein [Patescibacteria group bacterium]
MMVEFEKFLEDFPNVLISSFGGRYYGMDRDNNRERIQRAYDEMMFGQNQTSDTPSEYILKAYENELGDEFISPVIFIGGDDIADGDAIFHLNFRSDRAREMTQAIMASIHPELLEAINEQQPNFIVKELHNIYFATMTKYYSDYDGPVFIKHLNVQNTL